MVFASCLETLSNIIAFECVWCVFVFVCVGVSVGKSGSSVQVGVLCQLKGILCVLCNLQKRGMLKLSRLF